MNLSPRLSFLRHTALAALLVVLVTAFATPQHARAQQMDSTMIARFQLADSFMRAGQYDRAIMLLEDLYTSQPNAFVFYDKLKQAYESIKRYDDAIALVEVELRKDRLPIHLSEKARILYLKGDEDQAFSVWDEAIAIAPQEEEVYRVVYQSLVQVRQLERAIVLLQAARDQTGDPTLFGGDLAHLYGLTGEYELAMDEYVRILAGSERQLGFVRSRLSQYTDQEDALRASIAVTARAVRQDPLNRPIRELLGWLYIEAGHYERAFDSYRAIDRLDKEDGQLLFNFAQIAADARAYDVAGQAYEEILSRHASSLIAPQALAGVGEMHQRWARQAGERAVDAHGQRTPAPHFEKALATYRSFLKQYPQHSFYPEVLRRIGHLQQDVFLNLGEADAILQEVIARYPNSQAADEAAFDLGRLAVVRGELGRARLEFSRLEERLRTGELAEQARYESALLDFYTGAFNASQTLVQAIDVNTSTDVANDAIELKVLLIENRGPDSLNTPLRLFARAQLLQRQHAPLAALDTLTALLRQYADHRIADDARFFRARLLREIQQYDEALASFAELPLIHPASHLADRSLFAAAEILEHHLGDTQRAILIYNRLLSEYPGSLLASETRLRIRRLRGDGA